MYGGSTDATTGPWGVGVFGVVPNQTVDPSGRIFSTTGPRTQGVPLVGINDGTSNTLMLSEGVTPETSAGWGGPIGMAIYGNMGGAPVSGSPAPNPTSPGP